MNILTLYNEIDSQHFDLKVDHYGREQCAKDYAFGPTIRENYVLHFITEGRGSMTIQGITTDLAAGDMFLLPKNQAVFYKADSLHPWTYTWVGFSGSRAEHILQQSRLLDHYYLHSSLTSPILKKMSDITQTSKQSLALSTELILIGHLHQLLAFLIEEFPNKQLQETATPAKRYVHEAIKIIHTLYPTAIKVSDIATQLSLSRSYLYKLFKQETGYAIKDYILHVQMTRSCQLLSETDRTISEIAQSVGYSDPLVFSNAFKHHFSMSPSHYRSIHSIELHPQTSSTS